MIIKRILKRLFSKLNPSAQRFPAGHYHSPLVDKQKVLSQATLFEKRKTFTGIDLRVESQLSLLNSLAKDYGQLKFPRTQTEGHRYYYDNAFFSYSDAIIYSLIIRQYRPKKIIEVGSGFSSACVLDTLEDIGLNARLSLIEPNPERLFSLLSPADKQDLEIEIISSVVQEVSPAFFKSLGSGDILFIDSSHICKAGSDLNYLLHEILPHLRPGVLVHFHDVFHNFEYPKAWIEEGISLNEQYMLRSFLQYNDKFQILLFSNYMEVHHREWFVQHMPLCLELHERHSVGPMKGALNEEVLGQGLWLRVG